MRIEIPRWTFVVVFVVSFVVYGIVVVVDDVVVVLGHNRDRVGRFWERDEIVVLLVVPPCGLDVGFVVGLDIDLDHRGA
jgi:hypothetical protein